MLKVQKSRLRIAAGETHIPGFAASRLMRKAGGQAPKPLQCQPMRMRAVWRNSSIALLDGEQCVTIGKVEDAVDKDRRAVGGIAKAQVVIIRR